MSSHLKPKKADTSFWNDRRGVIRSSKGGLVIGEAVYCLGYDMLNDLVGHVTFFQVLLLNVTGKLSDPRLAEWLEAVFLCVSYPDSRIWCNQIGSLAGTLKSSPVAAVTAGIMASDSRLYGPGTLTAGAGFIEKAIKQQQDGFSIEDIVATFPKKRPEDGCPLIPGYIRPLISGDERIPALERVTKKLGYTPGKHLSLAYKIEKVLLERYNEGINTIGYVTAFLCDQGINNKKQYQLLSMLVSLGVLACYTDAADQPPGTFFPLRCDDIDYQGKPLRPLPE